MTTFGGAFAASVPYVIAVADFYKGMGFEVEYDTEPQPGYQADTGDIKVTQDGVTRIIEVKSHPHYTSLGLSRCPMVIIDKVRIFDEKETRPDWYAIVGSDMDYALFFDVNKNWRAMFKHKHKDRRTGAMEECYNVQPKYVERRKIG